MKTIFGAVCTLVICLLVSTAKAAVVNLNAAIDGAQADAGTGTGSLSTGSADITFDTDTSLLSWTVSWTPLVSGEISAHFHGPALPNQNAGVQVGIGVAANPAIGQATLTVQQQNDLLNGLWYINIHSNDFPAGEIRGQVNVVPIPGAVWLFGSGLIGLIGIARGRKT